MSDPERDARRCNASPRSLNAESSLKFLPAVGPHKAELLGKLGLFTVLDLLYHLPRRYEDRRKLQRICDAVVGESQVIYGEVVSVRERRLRGPKSLIEARLADVPEASGTPKRTRIGGGLELVWFNQAYLMDLLRPGIRLHAYGSIKMRVGKLQMVSPEFEVDTASDDPAGDTSPHMKRIVPVYPLTRGLHQRFLRGLVYRILQDEIHLESGPHDAFHRGELPVLEAFRSLHFPRVWQDVEKARARFVFDEYFVFASHLFFRRRFCRDSAGVAFTVTEELDQKIRSVFPFRFTREQDKAVAEISADLQSGRAMYRLLQGDVGTGKTAVAVYAMLVAVRNRCQAALMAPTEILAEQHYRTISRCLERYPVRVALISGSVKPGERRGLEEAIRTGKAHIVVGTHALIQEKIRFHRLGVVVIDEQHRFGVRERLRIRRKGESPHVLVMTATPIPRSLCLTAYGDLDLSVLRERPEGRQPVKTFLVGARERAKAMEFIRGELRKGRQAYFVYPLIEESEALGLPAAKKAYEHLSTVVFPEHGVGLVHGKLPPLQKDAELSRFRSGEHAVLVATVVVEVGIDVPNATVLFIDDASRFGLAQLHQLRGRVGRGAHPGCCLVGVNTSSREALERLKVLASTEDGFKIAEADLKLRGPGDYLGVRQSGRPHFLLGNPLEDLPEFLRVKRLAEEFWSRPQNERFRRDWKWLLDEPRAGLDEEEGFVGLD